MQLFTLWIRFVNTVESYFHLPRKTCCARLTGLQGKTLKEDLLARDFTINAMAVGLHQPLKLFDPLGGLSDLKAKNLRACSSDSFKNDPIRILRGIRLAGAFDLHIMPETLNLIHRATPLIQNASPERIRDELFRMLDGPKPATSIRALEYLDVLSFILPELPPLKGLSQPVPHIADAWEHTLDVVHKLQAILLVLSPRYEPVWLQFIDGISIIAFRAI
jgi:poly(A) polymerase